jgi:phosphatidylinositol glycan class B
VQLPLSLFSPWQFFCSVRTLSNALETALTAAALALWPFATGGRRAGPPKDSRAVEGHVAGPNRAWGTMGKLRASLILAAVATCLRPTNVLVWAPLAVQLLLSHAISPLRVVTEAVGCGYVFGMAKSANRDRSVVVFLTTLLDRWYYGFWTFPPLRFLHFNINQDLAVFYGRNRRDYYLTEGLPLLLTTALPFALLGMYRGLRSANPLAWMAVFFIVCLSLISHKEVRFLFPILPALHVLAAKPLARLDRSRSWLKMAGLALILALNLAVAVYTTQVHQRGAVDVTHFLRADHEARMAFDPGAVTTVGFLMPCHSTPWRSHFVHAGIRAWALGCEPPVDVPLAGRAGYLDEADRFYADPAAWVGSEMGAGLRKWPQRVAMFEQLVPAVGGVLRQRGYDECWRGFNSHWHDDWRRRGDILVWCKT